MQCDPPRWEREVEDWAEQYGAERVLAFDTFVSERFAPAVGRFHDAVVDGTLTHDGDPVLARHVANARTKETRWGLVITKEHKDSPRRIDGAVAAVLAHDGISAPPAKTIDRRLYTWG
jgi:phage terminase large subunit-like protein